MLSSFTKIPGSAARAIMFSLLIFSDIWVSEAHGQELSVTADEVQILRLEKPAAQVIVGNPSIADVAVQGAKLLVITGKTYGSTNLIVLDHKGRTITHRKLNVQSNRRKLVTLHRGSMRYSYQCGGGTSICNSRLAIGDAEDHVKVITKETQNKFEVSGAATEIGTGAQ